MSSKTRKLIWSVPLVATLAVVGALAVFVALGLPNANPAEAQQAVKLTPTRMIPEQVTTGSTSPPAVMGTVTQSGRPSPVYANPRMVTSSSSRCTNVPERHDDGQANGRRCQNWSTGANDPTSFTGLTNGRPYWVRACKVLTDGAGPNMATAMTRFAPNRRSSEARPDCGTQSHAGYVKHGLLGTIRRRRRSCFAAVRTSAIGVEVSWV